MKSIEEIRTENLNSLIRRHGTLTSFAEFIGKSRSLVTQWSKNLKNSRSGRPRCINSDSCRYIEEVMELPTGWFDSEHGNLDGNTSPIAPESGYVPLITWVTAGKWHEPLDDVSTYEHVHCPVKHSRDTFALVVRGISMYDMSGADSFSDGDIIIVDPNRQAENGDYIVAMRDDSHEATFKKLVIEDGRRYLVALNRDWIPRIQEITQDTYLCGVVIAQKRIKKFK